MEPNAAHVGQPSGPEQGGDRWRVGLKGQVEATWSIPLARGTVLSTSVKSVLLNE